MKTKDWTLLFNYNFVINHPRIFLFVSPMTVKFNEHRLIQLLIQVWTDSIKTLPHNFVVSNFVQTHVVLRLNL